jgi:hypothetical protein
MLSTVIAGPYFPVRLAEETSQVGVSFLGGCPSFAEQHAQRPIELGENFRAP